MVRGPLSPWLTNSAFPCSPPPSFPSLSCSSSPFLSYFHLGEFSRESCVVPPWCPHPGPPCSSSSLAPGLCTCSSSCLVCSLLSTPSQVSARMSPPPGTAPASLGEDRALGVILVCWHCYNKLSGLTTETCSLTVLGPGSKVKVWTGLVPPGGSDFICSTRSVSFQGLLVITGGPWVLRLPWWLRW